MAQPATAQQAVLVTGAYGMSKPAVEAYGDALSGELARLGAHVNLIEPGNCGTEIGVAERWLTRRRGEQRTDTVDLSSPLRVSA